jgi:DUF1680 family protein
MVPGDKLPDPRHAFVCIVSIKGPGCGGMDALSRGPLVYCLESVDNPLDLFSVKVNHESLKPMYDESLLGGIWKILGETTDGKPLTFIPYMLWGNRGPSQMNVFFRSDPGSK